MMETLHSVASAPLSSASPPPYIYRIVQHNSTALAAISSDDFLRVFTPESLQPISEGKHEDVTCLQPGPGEESGGGNVLLTAGRNAVVKLWDGRDGAGTVLVKSDSHLRQPITSLASCSDGYLLATGMEQAHSVASVAVWDTRKTNAPVVHYAECHNDDVTELYFSRTSQTTLLSGSTDGLVNIYNINMEDEEDALLQVANHGSSIHHAGLLTSSEIGIGPSTNATDAFIFALSHDETLSIYRRLDSGSDDEDMNASEAEKQESDAVVFGDLRPNLDCEYIVDILTTSNGVIVAAGSHRLDLVSLTAAPEWQFRPQSLSRLTGAHGDDIVRTIHIDERQNLIYTGGEDGMVRLWKLGWDKESSEALAESKSGPRAKSKRNRDKHFKPY